MIQQLALQSAGAGVGGIGEGHRCVVPSSHQGEVTGRGGTVYPQYGGLCLEAQHFPNAINEPTFPSIVLEPGEVYEKRTEYRVFGD